MSEFNEPIGSEAPNGVSRRTVTKAMAWAVPVIAVSAAVPAYAASQGIIELLGTGCKLPGNSNSTYKGYAFRLSVSNTTAVAVTINITSITLDGNSLGSTLLVDLTTGASDANPFVLAAGASFPTAALLTSDAPNSQNGVLVITYTVNGGVPIVVTATVPSVAPINGASCSAFTPGQKLVLAGVIGGIPAWAPNTAYAVADTVQVTGPPPGFLSAIVAGTSGATEPVLPAAPGGTVTDGTVTWQRPG